MSAQYSPSVTISLDNLLHNLQQIRALLPATVGIIAVIKDRCYGCGMRELSKALQDEAHIDCFAVATTAEAVYLRDHGIHGTILIFGKANTADLQIGAARQLTFTCTGPDDLMHWQEHNNPVDFHVEIDTGMRRLGLQPEDVPLLIATLRNNAHLRMNGIFTHMASADDPGTMTVERQCADFNAILAMLHDHNLDTGIVHVANSATILRFPHCCFSHVRPGIALYGCSPDPLQDFGADLRPVVTLRGSVVALRTVPPDTPISYGGHYRTSRRSTIATIGMGYAQGVPRYLSNRGSVLINGKRYTINGNVTMDYFMTDVGSDTSIAIGDDAVIIGQQGKEFISPDEVAKYGNTIGYEVMCNLGVTIRRNYTLNGTTIASTDPFLY